MWIRGKNIYYMYLGIILGGLYFLNEYMWRMKHKRPIETYVDDEEVIVDVDAKADKRLAAERSPLRFNKKKQSFSKKLITGKIPKVGFVPGNNTEAEKLFHSIRVICWIPTSPYLFFKRSIYVLQTWGKRCNKFIFFVSKSEKDPWNWKESLSRESSIFTDLDHSHYAQENLEFIELDTVEKGTYDLSKKIFTAWEHLYKHHLQEADWFIKVDDDTYVIMENLRYFLSKQDPKKEIYFGHKFRVNAKEYHSGGAGYVMSSSTLTLFVTHYRKACRINSGVEDMMMGSCLHKLGIECGETRDEKDRAYFYPLGPVATLTGSYPKWFSQYDKITSKHEGIIGFPRLPISFHYVGQFKMLEIELYIYYIQVYGGALGEDTEEAFAGGIVRQTMFEEAEKEQEKHELEVAFDKLDKHVVTRAEDGKATREPLKFRAHDEKLQEMLLKDHGKRLVPKTTKESEHADQDHEADVPPEHKDDWQILKERHVPTKATTMDDDIGSEEVQRQIEALKVLFPEGFADLVYKRKVPKDGEIPQADRKIPHDARHDQIAEEQMKVKQMENA